MSYDRLTTGLGYAVAYGPAAWYGFGIVNTLLMPSVITSQSEPGAPVRNMVPDVFTRVQDLRNDILAYRLPQGETPAALGTNFGPGAIVLIPNEFQAFAENQVLRNAMNLVFKHELSHINTSDGFKASALATLSALILAIAIPRITASLSSWAKPAVYLLPWFVSQVIYYSSMLRFEYQADDFACQHATDQELLDVCEFLKGQRDVGIACHRQLPQQFTAEGNLNQFLDPSHPPLTERLQIFEDELARRNIQPHTGTTPVYEESKRLFTSSFERRLNITLTPV